MAYVKKADRGQPNPANTAAQSRAEVRADRARIPMSIPRLKLHIPEGSCPGFHLHWFRDEPGRIAQALQGGYLYVNADEVDVPNASIATDTAETGNTDLGTRVSIYGGADEKGNAQRLYLMKIKQEWFDEDQAILQDQNDNAERTIRAGRVQAGAAGETAADVSARRVEATFKTNRVAAPTARRVAI